MKFCLHRGQLSDRLERPVELAPTAAAIAAHLAKLWPWNCWPKAMTADVIRVEPYENARDHQSLHIVWVNGRPFGFTDGPLA